MNLKMNLHIHYLLERTVHFGQTVRAFYCLSLSKQKYKQYYLKNCLISSFEFQNFVKSLYSQ